MSKYLYNLLASLLYCSMSLTISKSFSEKQGSVTLHILNLRYEKINMWTKVSLVSDFFVIL